MVAVKQSVSVRLWVGHAQLHPCSTATLSVPARVFVSKALQCLQCKQASKQASHDDPASLSIAALRNWRCMLIISACV